MGLARARVVGCLARLAVLACTGLAACSDGAGEQAAAPCINRVEQDLIVCAASNDVVHGIDVSKWQGSVDWMKVSAAGIQFAFARVSDGVNTKDATFKVNFRAMKAAGVVRGAYQFFRPQQDPIAQAELMLAMLNEAGGLETTDLPPVLDLEADDGQDIATYQALAQQWLDYVEHALGRRPIVYSGARFESFTGQAFSAYPLWAPNYKTTHVDTCPNIADGWSRWHFWQWTNMGSIAGIQGDVDRNVFDGTLGDLTELIHASIIPSALADAGVVDGSVAASDASVHVGDAAMGPLALSDAAAPPHAPTLAADGSVPGETGGTMGLAGHEQTREPLGTCR